jgi:hypothetical protein
MREEKAVELGEGDFEGWAFVGGIVAGVEIEDGEETAGGFQGVGDGFDVGLSLGRLDGAEAGVLEDPVEGGAQLGRQGEEITEEVVLVSNLGETLGAGHGGGCDIEAGDFSSTGGEGADVVAETAAGHEDASVYGFCGEEVDEAGTGLPFFPRGVAFFILVFPIGGHFF